ncbi:MAG: polysaccharide biosynthesis protein [Thermincolia bacterium]
MTYKQRMFIIGILDALIVSAAVILAYFLRFDFKVVQPYFALLPYVIIAHIILIFIAFNWAKIYRRVWQYASIGELVSIIKATTISEIIFYAFHLSLQFNNPEIVVPRSIYILSWLLITIGVGGSRLAWRIFRDSYLKIQPHHRRTLIIGAGKAGALIAKELKHSSSSDLYPVAFIDDDWAKWNLEIMGLPVEGGREHIPEVVDRLRIQKIIVAMPSTSKAEIAKIIDICKNTKVNIKILPRVADLISNKVSINMIREVLVEDLLGRDPILVDLEGIADYVTNKVVLVTGAGGSIGSELCRQISPFAPKKILLLGHGENSIYDVEIELRRFFPQVTLETIIADIQDRQRIREVFDIYHPSVVFHAAAHKHVPLMERNPVEAVKNNILGTKNVAECAHEYGTAHFVMISTDKAVNPTSVMGVTKRIAEIFIQGLARTSQTKFVAVRFGNVLGSRGSVIPLFKRQIQEGGPVTVTHPDMVRYFMTIPEAVQLVIQAGALAKGGEIFILDMGKPVKISDLARDLIQLSGLEPDEDIKIIYTGIRPGEKLFEEIMTNAEGMTATKHNRIFVGKPVDFPLEKLQFMVRKLEQVSTKKDILSRSEAIKKLLWQILPSYRKVPEKNKIFENDLAAGIFLEEEVIHEHKQVKAEIACSKEEG